MPSVAVTVDVRGKTVSLEAVRDPQIRGPLEQMARDLGKKLEKAKCPTHKKTPTEVRLHVDASGNADLRYESCCERLKDVVKTAL